MDVRAVGAQKNSGCIQTVSRFCRTVEEDGPLLVLRRLARHVAILAEVVCTLSLPSPHRECLRDPYSTLTRHSDVASSNPKVLLGHSVDVLVRDRQHAARIEAVTTYT